MILIFITRILTERYNYYSEELRQLTSEPSSWVTLNKGLDREEIMNKKNKNKAAYQHINSATYKFLASDYDINDIKNNNDPMQKQLLISESDDICLPRSITNTPLSPSLISSSPSSSTTTTNRTISLSTLKFDELSDIMLSNPSIEMVRIFISMYPWSLKQKNANGDLPLHVCLKRDDHSSLLICELLHKFPKSASIKDSTNSLPLHLACRKHKNTTCIKALLQHYPTAAHTKSFGSLPLHHLCQNPSASVESIKLLLQANPNAATIANSFGNLPLHFICASDKPQIEAIRILISRNPRALTHLNTMGETPISRALKKSSGNDEMKERIRLLLRLSDKAHLNDQQKQLLRDLNWAARKAVILICASKNDSLASSSLLHCYSSCIFRHIIQFI